ncbi:Alpha/Beta hydrolase protein [Chaetomium sp. MPI-SDFR-AT-0129]|nr:Alpha/Beta hydrolase protein [Chaetomium sp. MPI-SDFR-AT-0129]
MVSPPKTVEEILATGVINPDFEAAWKARGSPPGAMPADVPTLKRIVDGSLPDLQTKLAASRPANIIETEHTTTLDNGTSSRFLVCYATPEETEAGQPPKPSPIITLFHGGIHVLGFPEFDLPLARQLALAHRAVVVIPSTRKAPEHPFPTMIDDAWSAIKTIAQDATINASSSPRSFLPAHADPKAGFILGGASSGANFADVVTHFALTEPLPCAITGQFLVCGGFIDQDDVPAPYRERYLSREQNRDAPVVNAEFLKAFRDAIQPDAKSRAWAPFVQRSARDKERQGKHVGMPKTYFQVCGMDINRDDGLIYERVLREECQVPTRLDLYAGYPHCFWDSYPDLELSKKRAEDTIEGFRWLLS